MHVVPVTRDGGPGGRARGGERGDREEGEGEEGGGGRTKGGRRPREGGGGGRGTWSTVVGVGRSGLERCENERNSEKRGKCGNAENLSCVKVGK